MSSWNDYYLRDSSIFIETRHADIAVGILAKAEFEAVFDDAGNITHFQSVCDDMRDNEELYQALAPYMRSGCYLEHCNEMGDVWRWVFNGDKCERITAIMLWPIPSAPGNIAQQIQKAFAKHLMADQ